MNAPTKHQRAWSAGYEPGSVMDRLSPEDKKRVKALMKKAQADQKAAERGWRFSGAQVSGGRGSNLYET